MPKLWTETLDEHRRAVRDAAMDVTAELIAEHGLASATMSQIAKVTGIGRATLYKYFPDVEAILIAWHDRQIGRHLQHLAAVCSQSDNPEKQLEAVLHAYASIQYEHHDTELAALLHQGEHVARARQELRDFLAGLIAEGAKAGRLRDDSPPSELASYCLHALAAASSLPSNAAVHRLVTVTMDGLRRTR